MGFDFLCEHHYLKVPIGDNTNADTMWPGADSFAREIYAVDSRTYAAHKVQAAQFLVGALRRVASRRVDEYASRTPENVR